MGLAWVRVARCCSEKLSIDADSLTRLVAVQLRGTASQNSFILCVSPPARARRMPATSAAERLECCICLSLHPIPWRLRLSRRHWLCRVAPYAGQSMHGLGHGGRRKLGPRLMRPGPRPNAGGTKGTAGVGGWVLPVQRATVCGLIHWVDWPLVCSVWSSSTWSAIKS